MAKQDQDITLLQQQLAQSNIMVDATRRFAATLDPAEIKQALFEIAYQLMEAKQLALHLVGRDEWQSQVCFPLEGLRTETAELPQQATALRIFATNEPVFWQRDEHPEHESPVSAKNVGPVDSYLALPIKSAENRVGVLEAFNFPEPQNGAPPTAMLAEIVGLASLALNNAQRYQEAQMVENTLAKRATGLEIVSKVSVYAATILETDKLLQEVVNLAKEQFDLYHAHIYLLNPANDTLELAIGAGEIGRQMVAQGRSIPLHQQQSIVAQAARNGTGLIENDVRQNPTFLPHPLLPKTRAEMAVPMIVGDKLIGVLDVQSEKTNYFSEEDIAIQTTMAAQIAVAVENARSFEQMQEAVANLNKVTQRLTSEGWQEYLEQRPKALDYSYNAQKVVKGQTQTAELISTAPQLTKPLQIQGQPIGQLQLDLPNEYADEATEIVTAVVKSLSAHLETLRLTESSEIARANAEQRNEELGLINRMMSSVTASFDLIGNMEIIAQELSQAIDVSHVGIALLTKDKKFLEVVTEHPGPADDIIGTLIPIEGNPLTEQAIQTKKFAIAYDAQNNPLTEPIHELMRQRNVHMLAVLPMVVGDEFFGTVGFDLTDPNRQMNEQQMRLAETIVYQAATVVQNARLFNQTQEALAETNEQARRLALLNEMSELVSRQLTLEDIVATVMNQVTNILEARRISLHILDEADETTLRVMGVAGDVADVASGERIPVEGTPMGEALKSHQIVSGYFEFDGERFPAYFVPLISGESSFGTFNLVLTQQDAQLKENERQIILQIASVLAAALENLRLFEQTRKRAERERLLNKIVTQVAASLDLQHSLQIIVDEMASTLNVDQVRVALIQPDGKEMQVIAEYFDANSPSAIGMKIPLEGNLLTQEVIQTRQMVVVEDAQTNPRTAPVHEMFREQGIQTVVLLPLVVNDEVLGTIGLDILDERSFDQDTLQLAETIVYQAAVAIQNARLFEQSQAALAETETLYSYTSQLNTSTNLDAVLISAAAPGFQVGATDALLLVYDRESGDQPKYGQYLATYPKNIVPLGEKLLIREHPFASLWPSGGKNILFVGNVHEEQRLSAEDRQTLQENDVDALAIMFLSVGNLRLGQIIIRWQTPQTFTDADERLYGAIAQQASAVVYNRLLFNQTEEALSETAALYQASVDLNSAGSYEQVLNALRQHTILGQRSSDVSLNMFNRVWEPDDMPETVDVLARWSALSAEPPNHYKLSAFPEAETVLKPDELLICADVATDERMSEKTRAIFTKLFKAKSLLYVPLVAGGQWIGFLSGVYPQAREFPEGQIRRLNVLARQAAVSLQSIRLFEQTQAALSETEALYQGSEKLVLSNTEADILNALIVSTELHKLERANIFLFDEPVEDGVAQDVTAVAIWENEGVSRTVEVGTRFTVEQIPFMKMIDPGHSMIVTDVHQDPRIDDATRHVLVSYDMISFVLFPLVVGSQWMGMVSGQSARPIIMNEVQRRQANSLVNQASVVLQTTILLRQEQARARREQLLRELSAKVRGSVDVDTVMRTAVMEIGRTLGRRAFIELGNGQPANGQ